MSSGARRFRGSGRRETPGGKIRVEPGGETELLRKNDYAPLFPRSEERGSAFQGPEGSRFRKESAKKDRISRKKAVHRLDIFVGRVYNQLQYVMVWPGLSAHGRGLRPGRRQE